jgi:hypothetical protein
MIPSRFGHSRLGDIATGSIRDGVTRLERAAEALSSAGVADAAATVTVSEDARRLTGRTSGLDELDALLELRRASVQVEAGVAILQSADDMAREALAAMDRR